MKNQETGTAFDRQQAGSRDQRLSKLDPIKDALHLLMRMVLCDLPSDAQILCVGAGTGPELIYLAQAFPEWQFTVVEPAASMLDVCRQRAKKSGIASRCSFHEGYLESLPESGPFDAATCILVSQFMMQVDERRNFFQQIATRLRPNGYLVSCDLASNTSTSTYKKLFDVWARTLSYSEMPAEDVEKYLAGLGRKVAVLAPPEIEEIIASGGFEAPVLFFQNLFIHAWFTKRNLLI